MYQKNQTRKSKLRYVFILLGVVVALGVVAFALEKTGVTNLYSANNSEQTKDTSTLSNEDTGIKPTNTVDYSAPKPTDNSPIPDKNPDPTPSTPTNPELSVVVTNSRESYGMYLVKAVISGTDSASCRVEMSKGASSAVGTSGASFIEGQYSCTDLSIPMSELGQAGEWNLVLTVTDKTGATASTNERVIL